MACLLSICTCGIINLEKVLKFYIQLKTDITRKFNVMYLNVTNLPLCDKSEGGRERERERASDMKGEIRTGYAHLLFLKTLLDQHLRKSA